ncbi:hypothetical protein RPMA_15770 [Tardiphaga alba]|uniref:DUF1640 domain-containing protein n=1 Tax=Tardiphaga alba TaxID=340268 RepID=A0ABX8A9G7_9BRAD|nr:hypothetical protein [Tardiphaga alba]QUS40127.1 hypothetical protein RPMA_15770 [Tardiphaga alba]
MTVTFDTLTYSKRLREAGVPKEQADAHAGAALYLFKAISPSTVVLEAPEAKSHLPASSVDMTAAIDRMVWQVTVRVGGLILLAVSVLAVFVVGVLGKASPPI